MKRIFRQKLRADLNRGMGNTSHLVVFFSSQNLSKAVNTKTY
jgi:hypothetical protein